MLSLPLSTTPTAMLPTTAALNPQQQAELLESRKAKPRFITPLFIAMDTNPMVNAALVDVVAMVAPRTYVDTKKRNPYAGAETFFREFTSTFVTCFSAGVFASAIAYGYNALKQRDLALPASIWVGNSDLPLHQAAWQQGGRTAAGYAKTLLHGLQGQDGHKQVDWHTVDWQQVHWQDEPKWRQFQWDASPLRQLASSTRSAEGLEAGITALLQQPNLSKRDKKQALAILEKRLTQAFKANTSMEVNVGSHKAHTSMVYLLRDATDMAQHLFLKNPQQLEAALKKLETMNTVKTWGGLGLAALIGFSTQYINRLITKKRTGQDAFVGTANYDEDSEATSDPKDSESKLRLLGLKTLASAGIVGLGLKVMDIHSFGDFKRKLAFTGLATTGNAIKSIFIATVVGRFMAARNEDELRESAFRDYLAFLNWLVLGGFVAKGVAHALDRNQTQLFNISGQGKGFLHWLGNVSLKSHAELAAQGSEVAKKTIWKLNTAHGAGLLYSTVALGILLPMLNIAMTNQQLKARSEKEVA